MLLNIKQKRIDAGLTQVELARMLKVTQSTVASWEIGIKYPSADKLPEISRAVNCSIDELFITNEKAG